VSTLGGYARKKIKASDVFVQYESRVKREKVRRLSQIQNQRSGKFYTLDNLIKNGVIAESERELFNLPSGIEDFPYRQISAFRRIRRADNTEWFSTHEQWVGLTNIAAIVTIPVDDMHTYIKPHIEPALRNTDGTILQQNYSISDQPTSQVSIITTNPQGEPSGSKEYITPFNETIVRSAMRWARGNIGDGYNGCSLALYKESPTNGTSVKTIEEFLMPFDSIWSRNMESKPTSRVDIDQMLKDLKRFGSEEDKDPNEGQPYK
jgi:hypothetical protein